MTINFTSEEMKTMKFLVRMELDEANRELHAYPFETPANISRIKFLRNRVATLEAMLAKVSEA